MKNKKNWAIALILTAAAGFVAVQNNGAPASVAITETAPVSIVITVTDTPAATPASEGCGYMWAYHNAPELTQKFSNLVLSLDSNAMAHASLFGEDCVYTDGHADFHVMETDFYVRLPVDDLTNEEAFGNWMVQVMQIVVKIPREEVRSNYGFVEFWFEKNETEHTGVRVPIQIYIDLAQGKSGADLFRLFSHPIPY